MYMGRQRDIAPSISKGLITFALARAICSFDYPTPALTRMGRLPRVWAVSPFSRALPAISAKRFTAPWTVRGQSAGIFAGTWQMLLYSRSEMGFNQTVSPLPVGSVWPDGNVHVCTGFV